jgi:hypothetical protein
VRGQCYVYHGHGMSDGSMVVVVGKGSNVPYSVDHLEHFPWPSVSVFGNVGRACCACWGV